MRLLVTCMWTLAAVLWLGWAVLAARLIVETLMGVDASYNPLFNIVLVPAWPVSSEMPLGPWRMISWWPIGAVCSMLLVGIGWRIYWKNEDGLLYRPGWQILLSILFPILAPFMMYGDSLRIFRDGNKRFGVIPESGAR